MMFVKTVIIPELRRNFAPPFAWVDRRFLFDGIIDRLSHKETALYFFLVLAADAEGLSFYGYEKICRRLQLTLDQYIEARGGLVTKKLIAFDGRLFQVLALPEAPHRNYQRRSDAEGAQTLLEIFKELGRQ